MEKIQHFQKLVLLQFNTGSPSFHPKDIRNTVTAGINCTDFWLSTRSVEDMRHLLQAQLESFSENSNLLQMKFIMGESRRSDDDEAQRTKNLIRAERSMELNRKY